MTVFWRDTIPRFWSAWKLKKKKFHFSWPLEVFKIHKIKFKFSGALKSWYFVPPKYSHLLEKLAKEIFSETATLCTNFMRHKTCIISPKVLEKHNIPYNKLVQKAREIIIVFPYAYHSGFNHGFNIAEAINFASPRWIEYGKRHRPCDCDKSRYIPVQGLSTGFDILWRPRGPSENNF